MNMETDISEVLARNGLTDIDIGAARGGVDGTSARGARMRDVLETVARLLDDARLYRETSDVRLEAEALDDARAILAEVLK